MGDALGNTVGDPVAPTVGDEVEEPVEAPMGAPAGVWKAATSLAVSSKGTSKERDRFPPSEQRLEATYSRRYKKRLVKLEPRQEYSPFSPVITVCVFALLFVITMSSLGMPLPFAFSNTIPVTVPVTALLGYGLLLGDSRGETLGAGLCCGRRGSGN